MALTRSDEHQDLTITTLTGDDPGDGTGQPFVTIRSDTRQQSFYAGGAIFSIDLMNIPTLIGFLTEVADLIGIDLTPKPADSGAAESGAPESGAPDSGAAPFPGTIDGAPPVVTPVADSASAIESPIESGMPDFGEDTTPDSGTAVEQGGVDLSAPAVDSGEASSTTASA